MKALSIGWPSILVFILGCLSPLAFAPYHFWWLPILQFAGLFYCLESQKHSDTKLAFFFGLGWFFSGVNWVHISIDMFGGMPWLVSMLMVLLLAAYLALFPVLAVWLARYLGQHNHTRLLIIPFTWLLAEWLRSWVLTGFPWLSVGYSQLDGPLNALFPIVGEFGVNFVLIALIAWSVYLLKHKHRFVFKSDHRAKLIAAGLFGLVIVTVLSHFYSPYKETNKQVALALVQGNIEQSNRWQPENMMPIVRKYMALSEPHYADADIVIWPEAAIPIVEPYAQDILNQLDPIIAANQAALITGIIDYHQRTASYFNALVTLGLKQSADELGHYQYGHDNRFAKHHLLPIGEFVPFQSLLRKIAPIFDLPHSSFKRGEYVQDNLIAKGYSLLPAICFEIVFAEQIAANLKDETDFILTVSNDAWFGDSVGPHQHLQIARARALEFAKPVVRVTNTGITAIIDANGDIVEQLPQFEDGVLTQRLALPEGKSLYAQWQNKPMYYLMLLAFIAFVFRRYRQS
ncbi:apolipoprotein N-acyltransferase [Catenovulum sp. SM1970]|nr:apolipoprotein N-acyltransferase [Marinifaba aquimaris]